MWFNTSHSGDELARQSPLLGPLSVRLVQKPILVVPVGSFAFANFAFCGLDKRLLHQPQCHPAPWERIGDVNSELFAHAREALAKHGDRAAIELRKRFDPAEVAAALRQASLLDKASAKFPHPERMTLTRHGLEQATRSIVADRRAERLYELGARQIADLGCGLGGDAFAFARHGIKVRAVESDPETAELTRSNAAELGLSHLVEVHSADAFSVDLSDCDAVFSDPARRGERGRIYDPRQYSPPLDQLLHRLQPYEQFQAGAVIKLSPGIDHKWIPHAAEAEWISVSGSVVEACLWLGPGVQVPRRASVCDKNGQWHELTGEGTDRVDVGAVGRYLYEPDGAVLRAGLVAEVAEALGAQAGHSDIAYLYADELVKHPLVSSWEVQEVWPLQPKKLRSLLAERNIGQLTIKQRGTGIVPDTFRKKLRLSGSQAATLVATRLGDKHVALLCQPTTPEKNPRFDHPL